MHQISTCAYVANNCRIASQIPNNNLASLSQSIAVPSTQDIDAQEAQPIVAPKPHQEQLFASVLPYFCGFDAQDVTKHVRTM